MRYEETLTAYIDFLGFREASNNLNEADRLKVLSLLLSLKKRESNFRAHVNDRNGNIAYSITPAVSTFSDNILVSYPLEILKPGSEFKIVDATLFMLLWLFIARIASAALPIGFLIRGAVTIGKLHHHDNIVFGEALSEVVQLESNAAIYPRVIISPQLLRLYNEPIEMYLPGIRREDDGSYCLDYIARLHGEQPHSYKHGEWYEKSTSVISASLDALERSGKVRELEKWIWFAKRFRQDIESIPLENQETWGISLKKMSWEKYIGR